MTGSLCDVLPSVAALLGAPDGDDRVQLRSRLGGVRRAVVVLVDGLGLHLLPAAAASAPVLAEWPVVAELRSPFPSTTPTSLVSLGTGLPPGRHGVLGFTVNVPGTDRLLTHIAWRDDPPPRQWQPERTWFQRLTAAGFDAAVVLPAAFAGSGLTDAAYRGARFCAGSGADYADQLLAELPTGRGLVYGYVAELDAAAHLWGIASPQWAQAAANVGRTLARLAAGLPSDAALLVTADHGGLDVPSSRRIDLADELELSAGVRLIAGEPRVRYLHTRSGAAPDVLAAWRETLGERAEVLLRDEAIADGRYGPVAGPHRARIGDVVVTCRGDTVILATDREPPELSRLVGFHGARTRAETAIPLLAFRADR